MLTYGNISSHIVSIVKMNEAQVVDMVGVEASDQKGCTHYWNAEQLFRNPGKS